MAKEQNLGERYIRILCIVVEYLQMSKIISKQNVQTHLDV